MLPAQWHYVETQQWSRLLQELQGRVLQTPSSETQIQEIRHHTTMFWTQTTRVSAGLDQPRWHTSLYHQTVGRGANLRPSVCGYV